MSKIIDIKSREILDSRGFPTIEVEVKSEKGFTGIYSVPSGISTGSKEVIELRDNDKRYAGNGVTKVVNNINTIIRNNLIGMDVSLQSEIDNKMIELDGTSDKSVLGGNAILGVSIACLKAASKESNKEVFEYLSPNHHKIPKVMFNMIDGGMLSKNNLTIQEFMIVPKKNTFKESLECASEIYSELKSLLDKDSLCTSVGYEGGFTPTLDNNKSALNYIVKSIESAGYIPGKDVFLALDISASSLYNAQNKTYKMDNNFFSKEELLEYYLDLLKNYPIISIEDPYDENDIDGFKLISEKLGKGINLVGDDLFVTNKEKLKESIDNKICNSIVIKPNQIGTFYEMLQTVVMARKNNYTCIMSHRSGETDDTFIVDASVALEIPFVKFGSVRGLEHTIKYNRLLKIEEMLENK